MLNPDVMTTLNLATASGIAEARNEFFHLAALVVGAVGVAVILYGVGRGLIGLIRAEAQGSKESLRNRVRMDLGYYLLLGLEFLVAADVIETLMAPDLNHVLILGAIVIIRTVISFSLNWELNQHAAAAKPTADSSAAPNN